MKPTEQKKAAKKFVERWKAAEGNEQRESNKFWIELCGEVLGIANPTHVLDFERKVKGKRIDVFYEDMGVLIENKSRGVDLDEPEQRGKDKKGNPRIVTPYEQARWYADNIVPRSVMPKWIITCNFDVIRIYDLDEEYAEDNYEIIMLDELPEQFHRLAFFTRKENSRLEREKDLSVKAGEVVGKLYDAFAKAYLDIENNEHEQRSLNVLITRIVFLLFAEDADLLHERDAFYKYLKNFQVTHMRQALIDLFGALKTPKEERDPYMSPELAAFPYMNGGLFAADIIVPQFDENTRFILLQEASAEFDWKDISPTIFGAVFESTLNPETRRAGGMHYTSIENIHKLTGPLFYDALKVELTAIEGAATEKERKFKLRAFRSKIASLKFLDPACGSGNFLTETYLSLRKLENRVLEDLYGGQMVMGEMDPIQVQIDQFYGIEINDCAVEVAKTALWIAELQMLDQTREILSMWIEPLPLKSNENIVCANALQTDWNDILPADQCNYIIGNPPFIGQYGKTEQQVEDARKVWGELYDGNLDYVGCWYKKSADYITDTHATCALVSTNSICQGLQVKPLWKNMFDQGINIDFAYKTFVWDSQASEMAHVHVVIIGFSREGKEPKLLFNGESSKAVSNINPYLVEAENVIVVPQNKPLCDVPRISKGLQPTDGGNLIIKDRDTLDSILRDEPEIEKYIRRYVGSDEFINDKWRWCFWLKDVPVSDYAASKILQERLEAVREMRTSSKKPSTQSWAAHPEQFTKGKLPTTSYVIIPSVSSERREYVPMGFLTPETVPSNLAIIVPGADMYHFGILQSQFHNAWMRIVAGRLKSDYRYGGDTVYNTFPWPEASETQRDQVIRCAQAILDARNAFPNSTLANLYDPDKMPEDLKAAHAALDAAVEAAYGVNFDRDEERIVAHLFKLYAKMTEGR